jgi:hypothetical protein
MGPCDRRSRWEQLGRRADEPEVQALIREGINRGEIRVEPRPGGGVRVILVHTGPPRRGSAVEPRTPAASAACGGGRRPV